MYRKFVLIWAGVLFILVVLMGILIFPIRNTSKSKLLIGQVPAYSQGYQVSLAPYQPISIIDVNLPSRILVCSEKDLGNEYDAYLLDFSITQGSVIAALNMDPLSPDGSRVVPTISWDGNYLYTPTSASGADRPGRLLRYNIMNFANPVLDRDYYDSVDPFGECMYFTSRPKPLSNPDLAIIRSPLLRTRAPAIVNLATGQILGEYDKTRRFFAVEEHPNGNLIVLSSRRYMIDEQDNVNKVTTSEYSRVARYGPDLLELSPTLQFIRIIGENNPVEGKYEADEHAPISMQLIRSRNWIATASYKKFDDSKQRGGVNYLLHPKSHWFWGLIVTDYVTGNIVHHWHAQGGGLDSGIVRFDVSADGTKAIGKAGPEEFIFDEDGNAEPVENPYVYIFNLLTGQVTKADWGLEDGSDIEIVDSVNHVYCTLPSQQALVWFPMP